MKSLGSPGVLSRVAAFGVARVDCDDEVLLLFPTHGKSNRRVHNVNNAGLCLTGLMTLVR